MCTAAVFKTMDTYMGRTLDYEFSYGEKITITPRNYVFDFRYEGRVKSHYAIIGMAHVTKENYPLYYDAVNEKGLAVAGLNFVGNAFFGKEKENSINIAQFEFIPWILQGCSDITEVKEQLRKINITDMDYDGLFKTSPLHWIISDKEKAIVVESMKDGIRVYDNPVGVLTNNPPFEMQLQNLNNYRNLSEKQSDNNFSSEYELKCYSRGMGAIGLPGDLSSSSRFVRAAFVRSKSKCGEDEKESVSQFFHILGSVEQQRGCCQVADGKYEITIYTSCMNLNKGIYYYTTYNNHRIMAVDMNEEDITGSSLICYPMQDDDEICFQNR